MSSEKAPASILVVDDEPDLELLIRQRFRRAIREGRYEFSFAVNGREALEAIDGGGNFDIVLCDINMPVMDGLTFLSHMSEHRLDDTRTVIVSAYGDMDNIRTAMNRGAFDFITKPIDFGDLELTIEKTLKHVRDLQSARLARTELGRINHELEIAHRIQQAIIPREFPVYPNRKEFSIYAQMSPAGHVGGDFYDFFLIGEHSIGIAIGDVSGKGVPAALIMTATRALLKAQALQGASPSACVQIVNTMMCAENISSMFVSIFYGVLDYLTGDFTYCFAGHQQPYRLAASGVTRIEQTSGIVVGVAPTCIYEEGHVELGPGDKLFLYTDGIVEAFNALQQEYSEQRLESLLHRMRHTTVTDLVQTVLRDVVLYADGVPQSDDLTALAIAYNAS